MDALIELDGVQLRIKGWGNLVTEQVSVQLSETLPLAVYDRGRVLWKRWLPFPSTISLLVSAIVLGS